MNGQTEKAVHIEDLSVYYGRTAALTHVELDVTQGEYLGIIGPNGGGKSTLIKAILGLVPPTSGKIEVFGAAPGGRHAAVGYVPQFAAMDRRFPITLMEVVLSGHLPGGISPFFAYSKQDREAACALIERVGLSALSARKISDLSGGEFQRMLIARALAVKPKLLLLDEPTASVDAGAREKIYELLDELNREMTIILVTHDLLAISSKVRRLACLNARLVYHGEPELNEGVINALYGCPVDLIAHGVPHRVLKAHGDNGGHGKGDCCV